MSNEWSYRPGDWWAICDVCGQKYRASKMAKRWDGLMVCHNDMEARHPQDFLKIRGDKQTPPWIRPRPTDIYTIMDYKYYLPYGNVDTVQTSQQLTYAATYVRSISDSVALTDGLSYGSGLGFGDYVTTVDGMTVTIGSPFNNTIAASDVLSILIDSSFSINGAAINVNTIG